MSYCCTGKKSLFPLVLISELFLHYVLYWVLLVFLGFMGKISQERGEEENQSRDSLKRKRGGLPTFSYRLVCGSCAGQSAGADADSVARTHEPCAPWSARWSCGGVSSPALSSPCTASSALEQSPSVASTPPVSEPLILKMRWRTNRKKINKQEFGSQNLSMQISLYFI